MKKLLFLAAIISVVACSKESDVIPQPVIGVQLFTVQFWSPEIRFLRFYNSPIKPGYIELDEINIYDSN